VTNLKLTEVGSLLDLLELELLVKLEKMDNKKAAKGV
jgi:hypothetical protein